MTKHTHVNSNVAPSAMSSLKQPRMPPGCIQCCKVCPRACVYPDSPSGAMCVDNTVIPVLPHTSLSIHSASPWILSILYFALTYWCLGLINHHWCWRAAAAAQERASVWSGIIIIYSHHNIDYGCVKPDSVNDSIKCGYLIILLVFASQADMKFQYEKFKVIGKEEGLEYIESVFMVALLLVILFDNSPFVIFLYVVYTWHGFCRNH